MEDRIRIARTKVFKCLFYTFFISVFIFSLFPSNLYAKEKPVGIVVAAFGKVFAKRVGIEKPVPLHTKSDVFEKDIIETKEGSKAKILLADDSIVSVGPLSRYQITSLKKDKKGLFSSFSKLFSGKARVVVTGIFKEKYSSYKWETKTAVIGIRGTEFIINVKAPEVTQVLTLTGKVLVRNLIAKVVGEVIVEAGKYTEVYENLPPEPPRPAPPTLMEELKSATKVISTRTQASTTTVQTAPAKVKAKVSEETKHITPKTVVEEIKKSAPKKAAQVVKELSVPSKEVERVQRAVVEISKSVEPEVANPVLSTPIPEQVPADTATQQEINQIVEEAEKKVPVEIHVVFPAPSSGR